MYSSRPSSFPARLTICHSRRSGSSPVQKLFEVHGDIAPVDVATTADFSRDVLGQIVAPVLQRVESDHLDRVAELSGQKIGNDGLDVGALGFPGDAMRP